MLYDFSKQETNMVSAYAQAKALGEFLIPCTPQQAKGLRTKFYSLGHRFKAARGTGLQGLDTALSLLAEVSLVAGPEGLLLRRKDLDPMNVLIEQALATAGAPPVEAPTMETELAAAGARLLGALGNGGTPPPGSGPGSASAPSPAPFDLSASDEGQAQAAADLAARTRKYY